MVPSKPVVLFLHALLAFYSPNLALGSDEVVKDDIGEGQFNLAPGELVPENAIFSSELFPGFAVGTDREGQLVNTNPFAHVNLFKRAGCTFYRSAEPRTCVDSSDICCTDPSNAQDGWCCAMTEACGAGTGTVGKCTYRISYSTTTSWETSYRTRYRTSTTTVTDSTRWRTSIWTDVEFTVRSDLQTATSFETVTVTAPSNGRRSAVPLAPARSNPLPTITPAPTPAPTPKKLQQPLGPVITEAPKFLRIRGLLFPRQTLRTDTSMYTRTRTTYITTTLYTTTTVFTGRTSITYSTTTSTRTIAPNARTTVYSTITRTLLPGEVLSSPSDPPTSDPPEENPFGRNTGRKKLKAGEKAGIAIGVIVGVALVATIAALIVLRSRKKDNAAAAAAAGVAPLPAPGTDNKAPFQGTATIPPPGSPPNSDPRYSQMTQTTAPYGAPSPVPSAGYQYPQQAYIPPSNELSATPAPYAMQQQQPAPQQYQYPRPPSPVAGGQSPISPENPSAGSHSPFQAQPSEMGVVQSPPVVHPVPQRPA